MNRNISADEAHALRKTQLRGDALYKAAQTAPSTWNAATRSARFVMSTQGVDRMGDIVVTAGISTAQFERNPVALLSHDSSSWPIGTWQNLAKVLQSSPQRLEGDLVLHEKGSPFPEADQAAWLLARGHMRASSIGFAPRWDSVERILDASGVWTGGLRFNETELLECSLVNLPANSDALMKGPDSRPADELIRFVLREWALTPDGRQIRRAEFDRVYAVVGRSRVASIEAAAKQKRLADQRAREVAIRRARWQS